MPIQVKELSNGLGNLITMHGVVTQDDLAEYLQKHINRDPIQFKKYRFGLTDLTNVEKFDLSAEAIAQHSEACLLSAEMNPDAVVAIVAPEDIGFGLSRMWELYSESTSWEICIFRNIDQARSWIEERLMQRWNISISIP